MSIQEPLRKTFEHYHIGDGRITNIDLEKRLFDTFRKASPDYIRDANMPGLYITPLSTDSFIHDYYRGLKKFKRNVLGVCGKSTIKSYNNLAKILINLDLSKSIDESENILLDLEKQKTIKYSDNKNLYFSRTRYNNEDSFIIALKDIPKFN